MDLKFRALKAAEVDVRVQSCTEKGAILLLYKDARCDMNILDETVGATNWQREHSRDNANCTVSIWDEDKRQWVSKEDTGVESNTEQAKGLASDSFKRACTNWGIGRELYTSPFIWVGSDKCSIKQGNTGKLNCKDKFLVKEMEVENGVITKLAIYNETKKLVCFTFGGTNTRSLADKSKKEEYTKRIKEICGGMSGDQYAGFMKAVNNAGFKTIDDIPEERLIEFGKLAKEMLSEV